MPAPEKYQAIIDGSYFYFDCDTKEQAKDEAKKVLKERGLKTKDMESLRINIDYKAYNAYYSAIANNCGRNNKAAFEAYKNGWNWTCDNTAMWHQAGDDFER